MSGITLTRLSDDDREQFILDIQRAFKYGATEEFDEEGEISIDNGVAYRIREDGKVVGGLVLKINEKTQHNALELLFVNPEVHSKGIGYAAWKIVESLYPETVVWETCTPYFETRNIHFYVNKCEFYIVEFFNNHHPDLNDPDPQLDCSMFRFEKKMSVRTDILKKTYNLIPHEEGGSFSEVYTSPQAKNGRSLAGSI